MKLGEYLRGSGIKKVFFANKIGVSLTTLDNIINGKFEPKLKTALKIQLETNGVVSCEDLITEVKKTSKHTKRPIK